MPSYFIKVEYRGTDFHGFQKQAGLQTIQGALEDSLLTLTGEDVHVLGAGRTDAGVHAIGQVASFSVSRSLNIPVFQRGINALLPRGIAVSEVRKVRDSFDPRRDAIWREYRYFILNRKAPSPVLQEYSFFFQQNLDRAILKEACQLVTGRHDFSAFRVGSDEKNTVKDIMKCQVDDQDWFKGLFCISVRANSFMYKMVRILCRALIDVASGRSSLDILKKNLEGGTGPCAEPLPPHGLFLWEVAYPENVFMD